MSYEVESSRHATITIRGDIETGDTERFEQLANRVCLEHLDRELPSITAALDSPGGHYLEGLALGSAFRRLGYGTLVKADAECYSSAAFAFLGGTHLGAVGGWSPNRVVEAGAKIGFHSFYSSSMDSIGIYEGIEQGKRLAMVLTDYATALRIDMNFVIESLKHGPEELLLLQTVEHFRKLGISVLGIAPFTDVTVERAITVANYATHWKRPVSLQPRDGETLAVVKLLTANEYRRNILKHIVAPDYCHGPLTKVIRAAIRADNFERIREVHDDARRLNAAPFTLLSDDSTVFHVQGFEYGALFYVTDCYVIPSRKSPELSVSVVLVNFQNHLETVTYSRAGDLLYELHSPNTVLWSPDLA